MAGTLAELAVKIRADTAEFKAGLDDADKSMQGFVKNNEKALKTMGVALTAFGAAVVGSLTIAVKSFAGAGTELLELSQKTGISVKSLSELKYVGEMCSVSLGDFAIALRGMANFMDTASAGGEATTNILAKMGLSLKDLQGLSPEQTFMILSNAIASIPDPLLRSALAVDIFGRAGTTLLPILAEGADGIANLRLKAQELGITMSEETALSADALGDAFDTVKASIGGVFNAIGESLAPTLTDLADKLAKVISKVTEWTDAHPELTKNLLIVAGIIGGGALITGGLILLVAHLVTAYTTLATFITMQLIPRIVLLVTSLWAWVAAQLAAIAASGYGLPIAIALAAGIAILTTGIVLLAKSQTDQIKVQNQATEAVNAQSEAYKGATQQLDYYTNATNKSISAMERAALEGEEAAQAMMAAGAATAAAAATAAGGAAGGIAPSQITQTKLLAQLQQAETEAEFMARAAATFPSAMIVKELWGVEPGQAAPQWVLEEMATAMEKVRQYYLTTPYEELMPGAKPGTWAYLEDSIKALGIVITQVVKYADQYLTPKEAAIVKAVEKLYPGISVAEALQRYTTLLMGQELPAEYRTAIEEAISVAGGAQLAYYAGLRELSKASWLAQGYTEEEMKAMGYQKGGIVRQTGLAYVHKGETVIPANENMGGVVINFTEPIFFDREDTMNRFVDKIRKSLQRQDRLRFGGAYNG